MWFEDYQWHYDYIRLAWDTGFSFEKWKSPKLDKNKICIADVDRIVKERDVASVDRFIPTVVQYILEEEQAKVLDVNFVKIFRISQLAVEYLLFCKKYLDNTVVLLKKELTNNREENRDLKVFIDDLHTQIEALTRQQQIIATFKCSSCPKAFSSEDFLNAHIKRRHNSGENTYNPETDKLHNEIKELKERLNNTEKLLKEQDKEEASPPEKSSEESSKLTEVLDRFDKFRAQVDDELKELRLQKAFYEENYSKLFEMLAQNKTETATTQTDKLLQIENVESKNVVEIKEAASPDEGQQEIKTLETRISTTLAGIEEQMEVFWNKLNEIERSKPPQQEQVKPKAKPRSKLSQPTEHTVQVESNAGKLKEAIEELETKLLESPIVKRVDAYGDMSSVTKVEAKSIQVEEESDNTESASESRISEKIVPPHRQVRLTSAGLRPVSSKKKQTVKSPKKSSKEEIEQIVNRRLQELGISDTWSRLPVKSFEKALEIINHQATLSSKTHPTFQQVKKKIMDNIKKLSQNKDHSKLKKVQNVVKFTYRPRKSSDETTPTKSPRNVEIRNRALYADTDSDSDPSKSNHLVATPVLIESRSIERMKAIDISDEDSSETGGNKRGVLKSFPSVGSLSKKKQVLFDLESESSKVQHVPLAQKGGGSTTSVASSILEDKEAKECDDFELSDL